MRAKLTLLVLLWCGVSTAQSKINADYQELPDPKPGNQADWVTLKRGVYVSFASADVRYAKSNAPSSLLKTQWAAKGWKGEKVHTQLLVWTTRNLQQLNIEKSALSDGKGHKISVKNISANFVRYVMADGLNSQGGGCGILAGHDSSLVEDVIDPIKFLNVDKNTARPVWLSIRIPENTAASVYKGYLKFKEGANKEIASLHYTIRVLDHILPQPKYWKFHLDLWQNPYSFSRVYDVKNWSDEHFALMRPYLQMLANAGQKSITTTLIYDPWNSQTYDVYGSMVKWTKKRDGSWVYDYTNFDKWVSYMMSLGINKLINCYSMIPWNLKFHYYDEALGKDTLIIAKPGTPAYNEHWRPMLADFARHLKVKGWFNKTTIAMDERPMEDMQKAIALIKAADKDFKISLAGNYHAQIQHDLVDYSVASNQVIDDSTLFLRKNSGFTTTYYTCCTEGHPNTFTFSAPADAAWLSWYAANKGYDGYLRWAYNCWTKDPLRDTRFGPWSSGDAFLIYPGPRSSIRFERLIEGIQDFEKIAILKKQFTRNNEHDKLLQLERTLRNFDINALSARDSGTMIHNAQDLLNRL